MVGGNFDLNELMKNAKGMMEKAQERLSSIKVNGEAGAGLVKVLINAKHEVLAVNLDDELLKESKDIIEDLIRAAINDANQKIEKSTQDSMMSMGQLFNKTENQE